MSISFFQNPAAEEHTREILEEVKLIKKTNKEIFAHMKSLERKMSLKIKRKSVGPSKKAQSYESLMEQNSLMAAEILKLREQLQLVVQDKISAIATMQDTDNAVQLEVDLLKEEFDGNEADSLHMDHEIAIKEVNKAMSAELKVLKSHQFPGTASVLLNNQPEHNMSQILGIYLTSVGMVPF